MRPRSTLITSMGLLAMALYGGRAPAQSAAEMPSVRTIDVTMPRPVAWALDVVEKRYGVAIDYSDPLYASAPDTELLRFIHGKPLKKPLLVPRTETLHFQYAVTNGRGEGYPAALRLKKTGAPYYIPDQPEQPEGGITELIRQLLASYEAQGGPTFGVRTLVAPTGPQWEVYPVLARDRSGNLVEQPDFLGAIVHIPYAERTPGDMLGLICKQLSQRWGRTFALGMAPLNALVRVKGDLGADNITAGQALASVLGGYLPPFVWRMFYDPGDGSYALNIATLPYRQPPRPLPPPPLPVSRSGPVARYPYLHRATTRAGIIDFQNALAKAGYLHAAATGGWDKNTVDALRRFQAANGLTATGRLDGLTVLKLGPFLPRVTPHPPRRSSQMFPALAYWLESTPLGRKEVQEALANAGFYNGSYTGEFDLKTQEALRAFRIANGLSTNGIFGYRTAEKLAPYLPQQ